jgi:hypothetical protein
MNHKEEEPTQGDTLSSDPTSVKGVELQFSFPLINIIRGCYPLVVRHLSESCKMCHFI